MANHLPHLPWQDSWLEALKQDGDIKLYALVDPAQDASIIGRIHDAYLDNECLYGYDLDTPIAKTTPRLIAIASENSNRVLSKLLQQMPHRPVATLLAARCELPVLAQHLRDCMDVELQNLDSMFLAIWDPAILGTLFGVREDQTLHVPGPVLKPYQSQTLLGPIRHWWYWDRQGVMHDAAAFQIKEDRPKELPLLLDAEQTDMLVEASVPDHMLYHLASNLPELLDRLPVEQRYTFVRQQLARGRQYGLLGTGDLVNYISIALAFGAEFDKQAAAGKILAKVESGELTFEQALKQFPEQEMEKCAQAPKLL